MAVRLMRYGVTETDNSVISHNLLVDRELVNQHPISAISGLQLALDEKYVKPDSGIPIVDLGFNPATQEGLLLLEDNVNDRMTILDSDLVSLNTNIEAIQDFLDNLYSDTSSGVPTDATLKFAYRNGFREEFISEDGDTEFFLINKFIADNKHLKVYRDGELLIPDVDYVESSDNKITMLEPMAEGVYVSIICETLQTTISPIHEEIISIANQTEFTLKNTYNVGDNSLSIYVHGVRLELGDEYEEVDMSTIRLLVEPWDAGTKFIFRQEGVQNAGQILYHEKDYQQKTWKLDFVAAQDQTDFELSEVYIPGANMITVTADGLLMWAGDTFDYLELDDKHIRFVYPLDAGTRVAVTCIAALYNWSERFVSLSNQEVFELHNVYYTGRNDIIVYENGLQLTEGEDYEEISNRAIRLLEAPPVGSKITIYKRR